MARRILPLLVTLLASVLLFASPVSAHNSLVSSDPAEGAVIDVAPSQLTLVFAKSVPLDTLTIELIDAAGVRSDLTGSAHGPNGDTQVVTPLPALPAGAVNLRWRLVGPDGHPITGRVTFTIAAPATTAAPVTAPPATATPTIPAATTPAGAIDPALAVPSTVPATLAPITVPAPAAADTAVAFEEPWSTPSGVRWLLRFGSYVAIMTIGGVLATTAFVWRGAWDHPLIRRAVTRALATTAGAALVQLLVIASDIEAVPPWSAWGGVSAALGTDAGGAFLIRILLVAAFAWAMFVAVTQTEESQWTLAVVLLLGLMATWAFAGHSRSMRWALIGVPVDVAHHAAAAAWIGGLAIIGIIAIRECNTVELIDSVNRFAGVAKVSVTVIVGTGVLQAIRLVGSPTNLFSANHGKLLVLKVVVLGAMLKVADINRQRVNRRLRSTATASQRVVGNLRRAMGTEFAVGVLVVAVTAAMVVSPPAVADDASTSGAESSPSTTIAQLDLASASSTTPVASTTVANCVLSGSPLQLGAAGSDVQCLQLALQVTGFLVGGITGTFDAATDAAVRSLQTERGLEVDGIVGQITATVLGIWPTA
jgi:copper transport protein